MADLASIGIRVTTSGVTEADAALKSLANTSTDASKRIASGMSGAATSTQIAAKSIYSSTGDIVAALNSTASKAQIDAQRIADSFRSSSNSSRASMQSMTEAMLVSIRSMDASIASLDAKTKAHVVSQTNLTNSTKQLGESAKTSGSHFNDMERLMGKTHDMLIRMAAYRGISFVAGLPGQVLEVNVEFEKMQFRLASLLGSVDAAKSKFKELLELDIKSPFDIKALTDGFNTLTSFGLQPTKLEMKSLTDMMAFQGADSAKLTGVIAQLGQAWAKGKLQMQDMRVMIDNNLPIISLLKDTLHVSTAEILDMSKKGLLTNDVLRQLFVTMESRAPDAASKSMNTMFGALSNVKTASDQFYAALLNTSGENLVRKTLEGISSTLFSLVKNIDLVITAISALAVVIATKAIIAFSLYIEKTILAAAVTATATTVINEATLATRALAVATTALSLINPYTAIATAILLAAAALHTYRDNLIQVKDSTATIGNVIEATWITAKNAVVDYLAEFPILNDVVNKSASFIGDLFSSLWAGIEVAAKMAFDGIVGIFNGLGGAIGVGIAGFIEVFSEAFTKISHMAGGLGEGIEKALKGDFAFTSFQEAMSAKTKSFSDVGAEMGDAFMKGFSDSKMSKASLSTGISGMLSNIGDTAITLHAIDTMKLAAESTVKYTEKISDEEKALVKLTPEQKKAATAAEHHANKIQDIIEKLKGEIDESGLLGRAKEKEKELRENLKDAIGNERDVIASLVNKKYEEINNADFLKAKDAEIDKYKQLTLSARDYYEYKLIKEHPEFTKPQVAELSGLSAKNTGLEFDKKKIDDNTRAVERYAKSVDNATHKYSDFGAVTSAVFDGALGGVNLLAGAFDNLIKSISAATVEQQRLADIRKEINSMKIVPLKDGDAYGKQLDIQSAANKKYTQDSIKLSQQDTLNKLSGARQVSGAVESMFKKGSTEQRAAHAVTMALAGVELAMNVMKLLGIGAVTAAEVASVPVSVEASATKGAAKAAEAVATQATAGPYIGFALMAAMAIAMAAIGFNTGAVGTQPPKPTDSPTTGTVLGDSTAKSESINNVYELLKDIQADNYPELRGINDGIASLKDGITNVITKLFQGGGIGAGFTPTLIPTHSTLPGGNQYGSPIHQWIVGGLFGGKQSQSIIGQGIQTAPTSISDILSGNQLSARQYAEIQTKTSGGWFGKDKYSTSFQYGKLDEDTQKAMTSVFHSIGTIMLDSAQQFGRGLPAAVMSYLIPALTIDLKGLNAKDASEKLTGVINTALDNMAKSIFGSIVGKYQKLGEGLLETVIRILAEVAVVKDALAQSGLKIATSGAGISDNVIAISDALVQAAGGLREFQKQFEGFYDKFFTDIEKQIRLQKQVQSQLGDVNLSLPATKEEYKNLAAALDINTIAGQKQYSMILKLADAASTYYGLLESNTQNKRDLDLQLMELMGNKTGALTEKRKDELAAMDVSLRWTQKFIWTLTDATKNLSSSISLLTSVAAELRSALASTVVESSALNLQRRQAAQALLDSMLVTARSGGAITGSPQLTAALTDIKKPSEALFATFAEYAYDQAKTANTITQLADYADSQVSMAQKQLDATNGTTSAVLSVKDATDNLTNIIAGIKAAQAASASELSLKSIYDQSKSASEIANNTLENVQSAANSLWGNIIAGYQAEHTSVYGSVMNRPWESGEDTKRQFNTLMNIYNSMLSSLNISGHISVAAMANAKAATDKAMYSASSAFTQLTSAAVPEVNSFAIGTNYVPNDMTAQIHQGERIIPAADNEELMMRLSAPQSSDNRDTIREELLRLQLIGDDNAKVTKQLYELLRRISLDGESLRVQVVV